MHWKHLIPNHKFKKAKKIPVEFGIVALHFIIRKLVAIL